MRMARTLCCAAAIAAFFAAPVRADEWTKLTYFTFSGPVQVPGVTLPAGTYMFKLADPESGRRAIQIRDEEGMKIYTILLTLQDRQMEAKDEPWVTFIERPSGQPAAIRSWFYPGERTGYEFIYPKDEALRLARESGTAVLAHADNMKPGEDIAAMRGAQVARVDAQGQAVDSTATASTTTATTTASTAASRPTASTTTASSATTTAPDPSANRTESGAVGTAGQAGDTAGRDRELPRTASDLGLIQLLSGLTLASAFAIRQLRKRLRRAARNY